MVNSIKGNDILLGHNWKDTLKSLEINIIEDSQTFQRVMNYLDVLLVTKCTRHKNNISAGIPEDLYRDFGKGDFERMVKWCKNNKKSFGVLSGKGKGLFFQDTIIPYYTQNPIKYTDEEYEEINELVRKKALGRNIKILCIYARSPLLSIRAFRWVYQSGLKIYYTNKLYSLQKGLNIL